MSLRDLGLLVTVCLVWAGNSVISKIVISDFGAPPLFYTAARFLVVVAVTARWLLPAPKPIWRMVAVGLLMGGASFALTFIGFQTTTPSAAAVVSQLGVPMATILSIVMLGERIGWRRGLGHRPDAGRGPGGHVGSQDPRAEHRRLFIAASAFTGALGAVMMKQIEGATPMQFQAWVGFSSLWPLAALSAVAEHGQVAVVLHAPWVFFGAVLFSGPGGVGDRPHRLLRAHPTL